MNTESQHQIVSKALDNAITALGQCQKGTARQFLLSALIERATESDEIDTSCTHPHPQMGCPDCGAWLQAAQPQRSEQQEWTPEQVAKHYGISKITAARIAFDHNAELTAERQRREQAEEQLRNLTEAHIVQKKIDDDKLLSALAAIEEKDEALRIASKTILSKTEFECVGEITKALKLKVDLSLLHEHDAEVRKPLVEALTEALVPIAVLKLTDREKPYAEFSPELRASLIKAHDLIMSALAKLKQ